MKWGSVIADKILAYLYPRAGICLCCGDPRRAETKDCLCPDCRRKLKAWRLPAQACERCLSPVQSGKRCAFCHSAMMRDIDGVYAPYRYGGEVRSLILAFKFNACEEALDHLIPMMEGSLKNRDFDFITPVPLHKKRLRQRGFNQAEVICEALSKATGIPTRAVLSRRYYHRPQSKTPLKQRGKNVRGAFSCDQRVEGMKILLVDDVRTSGATAAECAKALREKGAERVSLLIAAVVYKGIKN